MDKIILVNKQKGWTSFDVVAKIRGKLRAAYQLSDIKPTKKQLKIGHAGTLDPFATGLLVILVGQATRRSEEFLKLDKTYEATIRLGATSTTGDPEGEITEQQVEKEPSKDEVLSVLKKFVGEIEQKPPAFSAIKINGQRAYKLAREGAEVDIPMRRVKIYNLELIDYSYPEIKIKTHVSSGTYIRSLAVDIGEGLETKAYCLELKRTEIAEFKLKDACLVDEVNFDEL